MYYTCVCAYVVCAYNMEPGSKSLQIFISFLGSGECVCVSYGCLNASHMLFPIAI